MINKVLYYVNGVLTDEKTFYCKMMSFTTPTSFLHYLSRLDVNNIVNIPYYRKDKFGNLHNTLISFQFERIIRRI